MMQLFIFSGFNTEAFLDYKETAKPVVGSRFIDRLLLILYLSFLISHSSTAIAGVPTPPSKGNMPKAVLVKSTERTSTFACPTLAFTAPVATTVTQCANTTINLSVSTTAQRPDAIKFVYFTSPLTSPADAYTATGGTVLGTVTSGTLATNTVSLTNVQLPDNVGSTAQTLYVYALLESADPLCVPTDQFILRLNPRPSTSIGGPTVLCQGTTSILNAAGPTGTTYQWYLDSGTAVVGTTNSFTTSIVSTTTTFRMRGTLASCVSDFVSYTLTPVVCTSCAATPTSVGGVAYRDFNSDGAKDANDPGLSNVTVTIFTCDATNQSTQVATMQTDINGAYSFTSLTSGTTYRVEFSNLPAGYAPTFQGTQNGTTVQFTQPGSCSVSLGLNVPIEYCQTNPKLVTPCYLDGAVTPNTTALNDVLVSLNYDYTEKTVEATRTEIGSTWGIAYARSTKQLYTGAFLKRHVGLKDGKLGQIYVSDFATPGTPTTPWLDVSTLPGIAGNWTYLTDAQRGLGNAGTPSRDSLAFSQIAAVGLGDVDISDDDKTLYVMDLTNRQLLAIDIATKTLIGKYPVPSVCSATPTTSYFSAGPANTVFTATDGTVWKKGYYFDLTATSTNYAQTITNPNDAAAGTGSAALYANSASTNGTMRFRFPVGNGTFGVKLHFATNATTNGRNMTVSAEGVAVPSLTNFDTYAQAGNQINVGITRSFTATVTDGVLTLDFLNNAGGGAAMVSGFELSPLNGTPAGVTRPFGIAVRNGKVYVGAVCDASNSQSRNDMQASVLEFNPATGTYAATPTLTFPLNYKKGASARNNGNTCSISWEPWTTLYPNNTAAGIVCINFDFYSQPVLSDIEFDVDGSMIIGFFDRMGHQLGGIPNLTPDGRGSNYGVIGGDILRAYFNGTSYELENNAKEGSSSTKPATAGAFNEQGPGGGEFYFGDNLGGNSSGVGTKGHYETLVGGLAFLPGSGEVRATVGDPLVFSSGGLGSLNNTTGNRQNLFTLFSGGDNGVQNKSNGLGDLEVLCNLAPIQIGNRVWRDDNQNGIQDPCEPAIPGAVVKLYDAGKTTELASVTTNAAGEYYFSSATSSTVVSTSAASTSLLTYNTTYGLVITSLGSSTVVADLALNSVSPLTPSESGTLNSGLTTINNDAKLDVVDGQSLPCIKLTTGGPGESSHTYDFGIVKFVCSLTATASASSQTVAQGESVTLTAQATPAGSYTYVWAGSGTITPTDAATVTASNLATGLNTFTVTVSSSPTCFTTATVSVSVIASPVIAVTVTPGVCQSATNQYSISGTVSLSNAVASSLTITDNGTTIDVISVTDGQTSATFSVSGVSNAASHTVVATLTGGTSASVTYTAPVACTVCSTSITTSSVQNGQVGTAYSQTITALGGTTPYTYAVLGTLPAGLSLSTDGVISGTPSTAATSSFTVKVTDSKSCSAVQPLTIVVVCPPVNLTVTSATICAGQSTTLTASGATTYLWSTGATTAAISASIAGTYSVMGTSVAGCSATATATLTVNPAVTATIGGALSICEGQTTTLTASGGSTYRWSTGATTATISVSVSGPYSVTATSSADCSNTATAAVVVNQPPSLSVTSVTICAGQSATLTANGAATYLWSQGGSTASIIVSATATTTYSVTGTSSAGCPATAGGTVTVNGQPQINSITQNTACMGTVASLTVNAINTGAGILEYSLNGGAFTTTNSFTIDAPTATTASVVVRTQGSSCTATESVVINCACAIPVSLTFVPITLQTCAGSPVSFTAGVAGATSASLTSSGTGTFSQNTITGVTALSYQPSVADATMGSVTLTLTSADPDGAGSCVADQITRILTISPAPSVSATSASICAGGTSVLTASGASTYVWSTDATTQSISVGVAGTYSVTGISAAGCTATASGTLTIYDAPTLNPASLPGGVLGVLYSQTLTASGGTAPYSYSVSAGTLPAGLNLNLTTGVISGTATSAAPASFTIKVTDANSCTAALPYSIGVVTASLGDYVFEDVNANGIQEATDKPIAGVTVTLLTSGALVATTTTDASGLYSFTGLTPGVPYSVSFTAPTGFTATTQNTGTNNALDSDGNPATGLTGTYSLTADENNITVDMGYYKPASLGDFVFVDANKDGVQDAGELPIPGVAVTLVSNGTVVATTTTDASGLYSFTGLTPGVPYSVSFTTPATYTATTPNAGADDTKDSDPVGGTTQVVSLTSGENDLTLDAGFYLTPVMSITISSAPVCNTATNNYTATATVSLTSASAGTLTITDNGITISTISVTANQATATVSVTGISDASSHTLLASLNGLTANTVYAAPVACTVCSTSLVTTSLSNGQVDAAYSQTIAITGGTAPYVYTLLGTLPAGLSLSADGVILGTPLTAATSSFTVKVTDAKSCSDTQPLTITIAALPVCSLMATATPGTCNTGTNQYTVTGTVSSTNAAINSASPQTLTVSVGSIDTVVTLTGNGPVSYTLTGLTSDGLTKTVSVLSSATACGSVSVTYTAPASCSVAPCGLALTVTPGLCLSANNTYVLSGSVVATNLPANGTITISSGAFADRTIAVPAGNASGAISYSGLVSNGQTFTVTASFSDTACTPVSQIYTAPASCSVAPICSISATASAGLCASATNAYSASVVIALTNAPAGSITVSLPGSVPITQVLAANTSSFTAVFAGLPSDGASHTATISLPGCGSTTATFTAPGSCSVAPACSISAVVTAGVCNSATNTFSTTAVVTLTNPPVGILTITDGPASQTFATTTVTTATFTAVFAGIISDGESRSITATLPGCGTLTKAYTAPASCSVAPICSVSATATAGLCATATNTYSSTAVIVITNPIAGTLTVSDGPQSATFVTTTGSSATFTVGFTNLVSDGSIHTVQATLPGCSSTTTTYTAPASCSVTPICSVSVAVSVGTCATATNTYSATAIVTAFNPSAGGSLSVVTGGRTLVFSTTAISQNTFVATFNGLMSDGANHPVVVSLPGCSTTSASYTAPVSCSVAPVCSLSALVSTGQCSTATNTFSNTVTVTMTNPTAGTLTVSDGVRSVTFAVASTIGTVTAPAVFNGLVSDGSLHTVTVSLPGCSSLTTTYSAPVACTVCSLSLVTTSLPKGQVSIAYSQTITASAGTLPYSFSVSAGTLPTGLSLNLTTGVVSGTPTVSGNFPVTLVVTDAKGCSAKLPLSVFEIDQAPQLAMAIVVNSPVCNSATNTYVATGTVSLTNSPAGSLTITRGGNPVAVIAVTAGQTSASFSLTGLSNGPAVQLVSAALGTVTASTTYTTPASCTTGAPAYAIAKVINQNRVEKGGIVTYTVSLTNIGNATGTNLVVGDQLSTTAVTFVGSATTSVGTFLPGGNSGTWSIASLAAGQVATLSFRVQINEEGLTYNTATAPDGQTAVTCLTVPFHVCANVDFEFQLTAPASFSTYQWSRNGVLIPGATSGVYNVTALGEYTVATTNTAGCADGSCCPFVVVADAVPSLTAVGVGATCTGSMPLDNASISLVGSSSNAVSYNISTGTSFTTSAPIFTSNQPLSAVVGGVLLAKQANPGQAPGTSYTIRVYAANGCYSDVVVVIPPAQCQCPPVKCTPFVVKKISRR